MICWDDDVGITKCFVQSEVTNDTQQRAATKQQIDYSSMCYEVSHYKEKDDMQRRTSLSIGQNEAMDSTHGVDDGEA